MARRMYHSILRIPHATAAPCSGKHLVYDPQVVRVDEALSFGKRFGRCKMPMKECRPLVAFEPAGGHIHAEGAETGAAQRKLEPLVGHFQRGFVPVSLG